MELIVFLQCVFHSIRFKVNISGLGGVPFFFAFIWWYQIVFVLLSQKYDTNYLKKENYEEIVFDDGFGHHRQCI